MPEHQTEQHSETEQHAESVQLVSQGSENNLSPSVGGSRRRRYTRKPLAGPLVLSGAQLLCLQFLSECRFLSLPQLARLVNISEKSARRWLRVLFDAGLVDVIPVSRVALAAPDAPNDMTLLFGSAPNLYAPTAAGLKVLRREDVSGGSSPARTPPAYGPKNSLFLAHELAVRDVRVWLEATRRKMEGKPQVMEWRDGPDAAITVGQSSHVRQVRSDAWFVYELRQGASPIVMVGLVEVDRGTERGDRHWSAKMAAYDALFEEEAALKAATGYMNARVLVYAPTAHRRDRLASLLEEIAEANGYEQALLSRFWITEQAALSRADLAEPLWRRPDMDALQPLVPAAILASVSKQN